MASLVTETACDYEGLSPEQQVRMNLQQTYTIYSGLEKGSDKLVQSLEKLRANLKAAKKNKGGGE